MIIELIAIAQTPFGEEEDKRLVHPKGMARKVLPETVPLIYASDYIEACLVLFDSSKASAALSRRCLQALLRDQEKVSKKDLADQIEEVIGKNTLPSYLSQDLHAVRVIGNFAAHPIKSQQSGEITDVEIGEAEWSLDVLENLFDFYFVQPSVAKQKRSELNQKLAAAGKPLLDT